MPFTLLEYVVRVANNIRSKFSEFSIDCNTNLHKMAQECTPEVTSRQMKFLTALREKGHSPAAYAEVHKAAAGTLYPSGQEPMFWLILQSADIA